MVQRFKETDPNEAKVIEATAEIVVTLAEGHDDFWDGAYEAAPLGDVLFDLDRDPMVGVLTKDVYRLVYPQVHELFTRAGTFEFYLELLRSIWGDDADITFTVPGPGKLLITIGEAVPETAFLMARRIVSNAYVYERVVTTDGGDAILVQDTDGIKNQDEVDALIAEISPNGVWVRAELTL